MITAKNAEGKICLPTQTIAVVECFGRCNNWRLPKLRATEIVDSNTNPQCVRLLFQPA